MDSVRDTLGVSDVELEIREIRAVLFEGHQLRALGDREEATLRGVLAFYDHLITHSEAHDGRPVLFAETYVIDYVLPSLLQCVTRPALQARALELVEALCRIMSGSVEHGYEVPFFRDYLRLVLDGVPVDLAMNDYAIEKARLDAYVTKSSSDAADALDALRCEPPSDGEP